MNPIVIKRAIYDALDNYDCSIAFHKATGDSCAYFTVSINEAWDWDWIEEEIEDVCDKYDLWIDDDSEGDFDLCSNEDW